MASGADPRLNLERVAPLVDVAAGARHARARLDPLRVLLVLVPAPLARVAAPA